VSSTEPGDEKWRLKALLLAATVLIVVVVAVAVLLIVNFEVDLQF
jgi:hypothetical protein